MSTLANNDIRAKHLIIQDDELWVFLEDGRVLCVPISGYPRLARASKKQLQKFEWIGKGLGIHWPDLDEDLSIEGFLKSRTKPKFFTILSNNPTNLKKVEGLTLLPITRFQEKMKEKPMTRRAAN